MTSKFKTVLIPEILHPICGERWCSDPALSDKEPYAICSSPHKGLDSGLVVLLPRPKIKELEDKVRETSSFEEAKSTIVNYLAEEISNHLSFDLLALHTQDNSSEARRDREAVEKANEVLRDAWKSSGLDFKTWISQRV